MSAGFKLRVSARAQNAVPDTATTQAGNATDLAKQPLILGKSAVAWA